MNVKIGEHSSRNLFDVMASKYPSANKILLQPAGYVGVNTFLKIISNDEQSESLHRSIFIRTAFQDV